MANVRNTTITTENIKDFAKTAAHFSLIAYKENKILYIQPANYEVLTVCPDELQDDNYYGEAHYTVNADKSVTIFITHRGTVLSPYDLLNDYKIYKGVVPASFTDGAQLFVEHVLQEANKKFPSQKCAFIHTGHSLGAILAEVSYAYHRSTTTDSVFAISFENPGSKPILQDAMTNQIIDDCAFDWTDHVEIYNADVNIINTCNPHFKAPNWMDVGYRFDNSIITDYPTYTEYFYTTFTKNQHSIVNIYNHFVDDRNIYDIKEYPVGRDQAFNYYMTYAPNATHKRYWDEAIQHYWDNHPKTQYKYKNDFNEFHQYIVSQLNQNALMRNKNLKATVNLSNSGFFSKPVTSDDDLMNEFELIHDTQSIESNQKGCHII